jgi:septal ring factor EnvC (AmiA/AmiB activator)
MKGDSAAKIETCSVTLTMFMQKYKAEAELNDQLKEKLDKLETENYEMKRMVDRLTFDKEQLDKQVSNISTELTHYVNESKKMQNRADKLRRQREEFLQMNEEERLKMIFDV